ncbi:ATP-binding protein [Polaribacter sp. 20A6]|uniref:ATP-binding protein n=1 Tax=Polaribacter sp. 20A6 TaxID=2687289 RepID=UPI0013FDDFA2|nr:ATPase, T2SS/T4P/T4SS family [Polaribacter sp. 20A6]
MKDHSLKSISEEPNQTEIVEQSRTMFDALVTRDYLQELNNCEVLPLNEEVSISPIRWYKIDKIVVESDVFFSDKLSMLYMSLHKNAKSVILVLDKQNNGNIELFIGARDIEGSKNVSGEILKAGMEGYFPGIGLKNTKPSDVNYTHPNITSVSAIASFRDDKKENFVQGLERLINATSSISKFRSYFIADSVNHEDSKSMIDAFNNLYTSLSPALSLQNSYQESESNGISESFTENFSKSIGDSLSKTVTHTKGFSETVTEGTNESKGTNSGNSVGGFVGGGIPGLMGGASYNRNWGKSSTSGTSSSEAIGKNFSDSTGHQSGKTRSEQRGESEQKGTNKQITSGTTKQITYKNRYVQFYLDILDKQLNRLQNGSPFGLWSTSVYFMANDSTTAQQLANIYRGAIIGEESSLETCAINLWQKEAAANQIVKYLSKSIHPVFNYNNQLVTAGSVVTSKELAIHLSFPQSSVPGIIVSEQASFARNVFTKTKQEDESHQICLGNILHIGKQSEQSVTLNLDELKKHVFVTGTTGSGKSNTMYHLLNQLDLKGKKFMVIEPAKGEYKHVFGHRDDVTVYSASPKFGKLLQINPFEFPLDSIDVLAHIDQLVEIFNACWPMYSAMPAVLKNSIISAYEKCGWDLLKTKNKYRTNDQPIFPTFEDIIVCLKEYINESEYSAEIKGNYKGALEVRLNDLNSGLMQYILSGRSISDEDLFNKNTIIDLSTIRSTETKSLIMGFLVMKLNQFRIDEGGMNKDLQHITIIEEAHNLLKRTSSSQSMESDNLAGKSVEMISNSIAEMRTYGECFIIVDQSPLLLDPSVIRNTNTKIVMSLPEADDRNVVGRSMALNDKQIEQIAKQSVGEAIIYQNSWEEAVQCIVSKSDYDDNLIYNEKFDIPDYPERKIRNCIVDFLLYPYTKNTLDLKEISNCIAQDNIPSSIRVQLLKYLEEFNQNENLKIWEKSKFHNLSSVISQYLNIDKELEKIKNQITDLNQVKKLKLLFDNLLSEKFESDIDEKTIFFVQQGYFKRLNNEYYNEWKKIF